MSGVLGPINVQSMSESNFELCPGFLWFILQTVTLNPLVLLLSALANRRATGIFFYCNFSFQAISAVNYFYCPIFFTSINVTPLLIVLIVYNYRLLLLLFICIKKYH